jgi:hypothetical protein
LSKDKRKPFAWQASSELEFGWSHLLISGHIEDVDIVTVPETISDITPEGVYAFPTSATTASVVSTSANDTAAGTGARTIRIDGLDSSFKKISETVILNGVTPVVTTSLFYRVNTVTVLTVGSTEAGVGEIDITVNSLVVATINATSNKSHSGVYTVPDGFTFLMLHMQVAIGRQVNTEGIAGLLLRENKLNLPFIEVAKFGMHSTAGALIQDLGSVPFRFIEHTDIRTDIIYVSANNVNANVILRGYLIDNKVINGS